MKSCCSDAESAANRLPLRAVLLFHYSLLYLALLFGALALDAVI